MEAADKTRNVNHPQRAMTLQWRRNGRDSVSNHQPHDCSLNRLFSRSKKTSKLRATGLCAGNSPGTGEFSAQMTSYAEECFHLMTSSWRLSFFVRLMEKNDRDIRRFDCTCTRCLSLRFIYMPVVVVVDVLLTIRSQFDSYVILYKMQAIQHCKKIQYQQHTHKKQTVNILG